jgi:CRISPR-associated protein Csm2
MANFNDITLAKPLGQALFDGTAKKYAEMIGLREDGKARNENKPSQLRRFYDELVLWETRTSQQPSKFSECLPFIRMINAKAAYAEGRKLVNSDFVDLMRHTLAEVKDPETLTHCKLFWEAFMGFYKQVRPKD